MISKKWNIPIPLLIDDEYLRSDGDEGVQPTGTASRMGLFVYSCHLFELLAEILESFYIEDSESKLPKQSSATIPEEVMIAHALDFNRRLDRFADSIPEDLQTSQISQIVASERNSHVNLQQQVLYCR
jgi:hypothetical protein